MKKEINLSEVGEFLQDANYIRNNLEDLSKLGLKFIDFPENIKKNPIFITEYFSRIESNKKEYKHIPQEVLKDQFFVSACLRLNPDIYLLADPICHTEFAFETLKIHQSEKYLKYAKESDLNNKEFCQNALLINIENFKYMPEKFRADKDLVIGNLTHRFHSDNGHRAEELIKYIPENVLDDRNFVTNMLGKNAQVFRHLPKKYRSDESIAMNIVKNDSLMFESVDESLKKNKEFVLDLLKYGEIIKNSWNSDKKFYNTHIIAELDESYFTRDFCERYSSPIRNIYTSMNKKVRSNLEIIRSLYLFEEEKQIDREFYQSIFLNKIPNEALVREMKDFVESCSHNDLFKPNLAPLKMMKLIETFQIRKELQEELTSNAPISKKLKL